MDTTSTFAGRDGPGNIFDNIRELLVSVSSGDRLMLPLPWGQRLDLGLFQRPPDGRRRRQIEDLHKASVLPAQDPREAFAILQLDCPDVLRSGRVYRGHELLFWELRNIRSHCRATPAKGVTASAASRSEEEVLAAGCCGRSGEGVADRGRYGRNHGSGVTRGRSETLDVSYRSPKLILLHA